MCCSALALHAVASAQADSGWVLNYVSCEARGRTSLYSLSPTRKRRVWSRSLLPVGARLLHVSSAPDTRRIGLLYRSGRRTLVRLVSLQDGRPIESPRSVDPSATEILFAKGRLWLLSSDGPTLPAVGGALQTHGVPQEVETGHFKTFDWSWQPKSQRMYFVQSEGYLDIGQGDLKVFDLSSDGPRRVAFVDCDKGPFLVAATARHLVVLGNEGAISTYDSTQASAPALLRSVETLDQWLAVWPDVRRDVFYAAHDAGFQAFRVAEDGRLAPSSPALPFEAGKESQDFEFCDFGRIVCLFDDTGHVQSYQKESNGNLSYAGIRRIGLSKCWPVRIR